MRRIFSWTPDIISLENYNKQEDLFPYLFSLPCALTLTLEGEKEDGGRRVKAHSLPVGCKAVGHTYPREKRKG